MKVLAINGSPNKEGNTFHALTIVGSKLKEQDIEFEILHIGNKAVRGCMACGKCRETKDEKCSVTTDPLNEWIQKMKAADGLILASPVHFSGIPGTMKSFLDRAFYVSSGNGNLFRHKVGAAVVAVRRSGGSSTFDSLNHYLMYCEMILATSNYWNIIHGRTAEPRGPGRPGRQQTQPARARRADQPPGHPQCRTPGDGAQAVHRRRP